MNETIHNCVTNGLTLEEMKDKIFCQDCLEGMKAIPDGSVDLVVTDPPYEMHCNGSGAGAFGRSNRDYHGQLDAITNGIGDEFLEEMLRVCRKPNIYLFCSKGQLLQYLSFADRHGLSIDLLAWHKTNPVPTCNNKYLSDTEYIVFMRNGAPLYGTYETKRKFYVTQTNVEDKRMFGHPTCKPEFIVRNFIVNSSVRGGGSAGPVHGQRHDSRGLHPRAPQLHRLRAEPGLLREEPRTYSHGGGCTNAERPRHPVREQDNRIHPRRLLAQPPYINSQGTRLYGPLFRIL